MRRPLFGNGIPQPVAAGGSIQVFDTEAADPPNEEHIFALTLFLWQNFSEGVDSETTVWVVTNGGAPIAYNVLPVANMAARRLSPNGAFLLADRLVVRGNQQVFVGVPAGGLGGCFVYGYYEMDGIKPNSPNYRPLQPTNNLVSPFNAPMATIAMAAGDPGQTVLAHQLTTEYTDLIEMNLSAAQAGASPSQASVILPTGLEMTYITQPGGALLNDVLFPGIPMRAPSSSQTDLSLKLLGPVPANAVGASLLGHFSRS